LLCVPGDRGQRSSHAQGHLSGNFAVQNLLLADLFQIAEVVDQAGYPQTIAIS
jgi:hypothetical protein